MPTFADLLERGVVLLCDGATGTSFQEMGIEPGVAPEEWVFDAPDRVLELHRRYVEAGSEIVLTCSFGGSPIRLQDGPLAGRAHELNRRAAQLAREVAGDELVVAGAIGPTGQLAEPFGPLTREAAVDAFGVQARALDEGGVDLLLLETFFALDEGLWAVEGIRSVTDLPVAVCFSFDQGTRTMMGLSPTELVRATESLGLVALGANCGRSLDDTALLVEEFIEAGLSVPLWIKPNAGVPQVTAAGVVYPETPESFSARLAEFAQRGARIVGGCCGSTPAHLSALRDALGRQAA
jgi:5-methyltetrahydrofolate--homocysteine methyltransferase